MLRRWIELAGALVLGAVIALVAARWHYGREIARLRMTLKLAEQSVLIPPEAHRLTDRQKQFLVKVLSGAKQRAVVYLITPSQDRDALDYATDLREVLKRSGWQMHDNEPQIGFKVAPGFWEAMKGMILFVNDRDASPGVTFLANAMKVAGLKVRWGGDGRLPANACELLVGERPGRG